jgi:acyl carrier protein
MMSIEEFTRALESEFEDLTPGTLTPAIPFKSIKGWSSMHALIIIAFADAQFDVLLTGADLKSTVTVADLYDLVKAKKN